MNIPEKFKILVITLSDRAHKGEYEDLSGPRIKEIMFGILYLILAGNIRLNLTLLPDDAEMLKGLLLECFIIFII